MHKKKKKERERETMKEDTQDYLKFHSVEEVTQKSCISTTHQVLTVGAQI